MKGCPVCAKAKLGSDKKMRESMRLHAHVPTFQSGESVEVKMER